MINSELKDMLLNTMKDNFEISKFPIFYAWKYYINVIDASITMDEFINKIQIVKSRLDKKAYDNFITLCAVLYLSEVDAYVFFESMFLKDQRIGNEIMKIIKNLNDLQPFESILDMISKSNQY